MKEESLTEFNGTLAQCLEQGQYFDIDVTTVERPKSFHISLAQEKLNVNPDATRGLHVVVNVDEFKVSAENQDGDTVTQEFYTLNPDINVNIQIYDNSFHVCIDGNVKLRLTHSHRIDLLKAIQIAGDVKLIKRVDHRKVYPTVWPPSACIPYYPSAMYFSNDIPIRFKPEHLMVLTARCYQRPTGNFYINLKHAHDETLLMHVSVDFDAKTVFRSHLDSTGHEFYAHAYSANQTHGGFPFDFQKTFRIGIACKEQEFLIAINGLYFCSFAYTDPENRHPEGVVARPYANVLSNIVGMKVFSRHGAGIKVTELDHIMLDNPECTTFEKYTKIDNDLC